MDYNLVQIWQAIRGLPEAYEIHYTVNLAVLRQHQKGVTLH